MTPSKGKTICALELFLYHTFLGTLMLDAEILCVVNEIINDLSGLKNKNFIIHINHTSLIRAILLHCGIKEKFNDVYQVLSDVRVLSFSTILTS